MADIVADFSITFVQGTPSTWRLLVASGWSGVESNLKGICCGEPLPKELVEQLLSRNINLWNMYGPTETTVYSTGTQITSNNLPIPIGTPVENNEVYILDQNRQHLPAGVSGEICIGGDGVALGYLGRLDLTADKFVDVSLPTGEVIQMYRTGDLGFRGMDGVFYHQGRMDFQVKLRGYRIELGEIEARLVEHSDVKQAVADVWSSNGEEPELIAYVLPESDSRQPDHVEIRAYRSANLPAYLLPQRVEWLSEFPLTPNGKVDRKKLFPASVEIAGTINNSEMSSTEAAITSSWGELIGGYVPGRNDNFFEIGGHSLLAVRALMEIRDKFGVHIQTHMIALEELATAAAFVDYQTDGRFAKESVFRGVVSRLKKAILRRPAV